MQSCLLLQAKLNMITMILSITSWEFILLPFSAPLLRPLPTSYTLGSPINLHLNTFPLFAYVEHSIGSHLQSLHMLPCFLKSHQTPSPLPFHLPVLTCFMVSYSSFSPLLSLDSSKLVQTKPNLKPGFNVKLQPPATLDVQGFSQEQKPSAYTYAFWAQKLASIVPLEPSTQFHILS